MDIFPLTVLACECTTDITGRADTCWTCGDQRVPDSGAYPSLGCGLAQHEAVKIKPLNTRNGLTVNLKNRKVKIRFRNRYLTEFGKYLELKAQ